MNILILGARAPAAVELATVLIAGAHSVWMADSMRFPVGAACAGLRGTLRLRAPRAGFAAFCEDLSKACTAHRIDTVIPVSEETFWLALARAKLPSGVDLRTSAIEVLERLHNKASFSVLAGKLGYGASENIHLSSLQEGLSLDDPYNFVFKPVYSRFASRTLVRPSRLKLQQWARDARGSWLAQGFVAGRELCCYNLACKGRLILHQAYEPRLRVGVGAGLYIDPVRSDILRRMAERFIAETQFTGQISFDAIEGERGLVAIECNPRCTSGVHLAVQNPARLAQALLGKEMPEDAAFEPRARMLLLPILLTRPTAIFTREGRSLFRAADDVFGASGIGLGRQGLAMAELMYTACMQLSSLRRASTTDIEWNGEVPDV